MSNTINYRGYQIKIKDDTDPGNPRTEWDNLGTMVCMHRRYQLGDEPYNEYDNGFEMWTKLAGVEEFDPKYEDVSEQEMLADCVKIFSEKHVWLPLYLLDHSGITMRTTDFSDPWDSGRVGIIYVSHDKIKEEYGDTTEDTLKKVEGYLKGEVETYDQFLKGEVYGFQVISPDGTELDSCWGFYGDHEESGLLEHAKNAIDCAIGSFRKKHLEKLKTFIKNKVPLSKRSPFTSFN